MARTARIMSVFLASPSDVSAEREFVADSIREWNQVNGRSRGVIYDLIRWETDVSAGFGTDGQDVINQQIGDEYDLLIALFWTRLGSATPRAQSGSVEEYQRALDRRRTGELVEIAFLFKDALINLREVDPDNLKSLREFEVKVRSDGALAKTFKDVDGLKFGIRILLDRLAHQSIDSANANAVPTDGKDGGVRNVKTSLSNSFIEPEELGLFDISENLTRHSTDTSAVLGELGVRLDEMTAVNTSVVAEISEIAKHRKLDPNEARPYVARITFAMNEFSEFVDSRLPVFSENSVAMANDILALIAVSYDFNDDRSELISFRDTIVSMASSMDGALDGLRSMLQATSELQRTTKEFNQAKRRMIVNTTGLIDAVCNAQALTVQALVEMDALIESRGGKVIQANLPG